MINTENWTLQNAQDECVTPLIYSNGKTQEDIVKEVCEAFESYDVVTLKGGVGSGKSVVALQTVSRFGSGIIAVPTKILQRQYVNSYCKGKGFHFSSYGRKLPVNFMFGATNYNCAFTNMSENCASENTPCRRKLLKGESRVEASEECPNWAPVYPEGLVDKIELHLPNHEQIPYTSIKGEKVFFCPENPCDYYQQFGYYTRDGAIIMNLAKWLVETWIGRKKKVPIEIIDEGDMFLDNLSFRTTIGHKTFFKLKNGDTRQKTKYYNIIERLNRYLDINPNFKGIITQELIELLSFIKDELQNETAVSQSLEIKINLFLDYPSMTYAQVKDDKITIFLSRPDVTFNELKQKSGKILLMSATVQDPKIYSSVFRLQDVPVVQAEPKFPGNLKLMFTRDSINITFQEWIRPGVQKRYYELLEKMVEKATRPTLVQVHAMKYIPMKYKSQLNQGFVDGVSWSTVTDRGVDLPDDKCRSVIITKFPIPNLADVVFEVMRETYSNHIYWKYIMDIADRELIQQCGRALRHKNDWCEIWSPDKKVLSNLLRLWKGHKDLITVGSLV